MGAVFRTLGIGLVTAIAAVGSVTGAAVASPAVSATAVSAARAALTPGAGFIYGTDSWPVPGTGTAPYHEPVTGGAYGGYIGMAGNWARTIGCSTGNFLAWAPANSAQANVNFTTYHIGIGTGVYWYMGGPGVDPHWNNTAAEAYKWGQQQAAWALAAAAKLKVTYPVMWEDIELPGIAPAPDNGWNSVYSSPCSGVKIRSFVPVSLDRADFNGFTAYIRAHSKFFKVGVYSEPGIWKQIFGTGPASLIPYTYEWTYMPETSHLSQAPTGWCLGGGAGCARFFGGTTSANKYAVMWQWSGGGGITNGIGDFDQIDIARLK
jgi:hypothetical protein